MHPWLYSVSELYIYFLIDIDNFSVNKLYIYIIQFWTHWLYIHYRDPLIQTTLLIGPSLYIQYRDPNASLDPGYNVFGPSLYNPMYLDPHYIPSTGDPNAPLYSAIQTIKKKKKQYLRETADIIYMYFQVNWFQPSYIKSFNFAQFTFDACQCQTFRWKTWVSLANLSVCSGLYSGKSLRKNPRNMPLSRIPRFPPLDSWPKRNNLDVRGWATTKS